uniref:ATP-dependent Clp protease proteolytic subunit n=1 Tax=Sphingobacterium sp. (strain 21) TaxID=743722 RepID=F4C2E1_SPHS2
MKQPFFQVVSNKSDQVGRINIYGFIGDYWEKANTATNFEREFRALEEKHDRIDIYINSPGGSVWEGLPIFNTIRSSQKEIHTYVNGIAFSMGFMLLLSAKNGRRHAFKGSIGMAHNVSTYDYGNAKQLRKSADELDKYDDVLSALIAECSGKTVEQVKSEWLNYEDHFFTPDEMKAEGFVNHIEDDEASDMPENVQNLSFGQIAAYYNERMEEPTQSLVDKVLAKITGKTSGSTQNQSDNMFGNKFPKMKALAKVAAASHTAEAIEAVNTEIAENEIEGVTLVLDSELEQVNNRNTQLENNAKADATKIANLESKIKELEAEVANYKAKDKTPAAESAAPVTNANDRIAEGADTREVENFETSADRDLKKMFG